MKKIIPFKKEILFNNNISEIISISLEHSLHKADNNLISGSFIVSGEYLITETSINTESFSYDLPFNIDVDSKYNIDNVDIDINDFYYEILDNKKLLINIEVKLDKIEEILVERNEELDNLLNSNIDLQSTTEDKDDLMNQIGEIEEKDESEKRCIDDSVDSIFSNIDMIDNYVSYKVYIVRENDSLESIIEKYHVSKTELELYNNLSDLKIGDKVIIPYVKNQ